MNEFEQYEKELLKHLKEKHASKTEVKVQFGNFKTDQIIQSFFMEATISKQSKISGVSLIFCSSGGYLTNPGADENEQEDKTWNENEEDNNNPNNESRIRTNSKNATKGDELRFKIMEKSKAISFAWFPIVFVKNSNAELLQHIFNWLQVKFDCVIVELILKPYELARMVVRWGWGTFLN